MDRDVRRRWLPALVVVGVLAATGLLVITTDDDTDGLSTGSCITLPADASVARVWNEQALDAVRRDTPAPTVHARNLYHLSVVFWDVWAAFDDDAAGLFVTEKVEAADVAAARVDAMNFGAYRLLLHRYRNATGRNETRRELEQAIQARCGVLDFDRVEGGSAAAFGVRVADAVIDATLNDGSLERLGYEDVSYQPVNPPLIVDESGTVLEDPNRWQPLTLEVAVAQNGLPLPGGEQQFIGPNWGSVSSFALPDPGADGLPIDPGAPPLSGDPETDLEFREAITEVIAAGADLATGEATIDIGPAAMGNNTLGADDGNGHPQNPVTGAPYAANPADRGDYTRVIAEYWADGPESETPPGHWNVIANEVSDLLPPDELRPGGVGEPVDRLEWDVKLYLALNGATHDAAIAAWGAKAHYDYIRPISMVRHAGGLGQSSDPEGPAYDPAGLLLEPGIVEVITEATSAPGERHQALAAHVGEIAVRSWAGAPQDPDREVSGVAWILAVDWVPYQRPTFVTPSFAAYVSGHSAFSRAGAEVLAAFTGSAFFPGGLSSWTVEPGGLIHEAGPTAPVTLQWATYFDAADEAGRSRIHGGIHVEADDLAGRLLGAECGRRAWERAQELW